MTQSREPAFEEEEIYLREYLLVLLRKWWMVAGAIVIALAAAAGFSLAGSGGQYEARTKILLVTAPSAAIGIIPEPQLTVETLSALATNNDVLQQVIFNLDLRDEATGRLWNAGRLAGMISSQVETDEGKIFVMTVRGPEPDLVKGITDEWTTVFIDWNRGLATAEAQRSSLFATARYEAASQELKVYEEARQAEISRQSLEQLYESTSLQLERRRDRLVEVTARLETVQEAFDAEDPVITLTRGIPESALQAILATNPDSQTMAAIAAMVVTDQIRNDFYFALKQELLSLRTDRAALDAEIAHTEMRVAELQGDIDELAAVASPALDLRRIDHEIGLLSASLDRLAATRQHAEITLTELDGSIRIVESAIEPTPSNGPGGLTRAAMAGTLGLMAGVMGAFVVQYVQDPSAFRPQLNGGRRERETGD